MTSVIVPHLSRGSILTLLTVTFIIVSSDIDGRPGRSSEAGHGLLWRFRWGGAGGGAEGGAGPGRPTEEDAFLKCNDKTGSGPSSLQSTTATGPRECKLGNRQDNVLK